MEGMIERVKPPLPGGSEFGGLHYLLTTPFRYPPLRHGSRFATRHERSLFYGSVELRAAFAEVAYYRLVFLHGSRASLGTIETDLSAFKVHDRTRKGVDLTRPPYDRRRAELSAPDRYDAIQKLGAQMRSVGVEAFRYASARDAKGSINVGLYTPAVFGASRPDATQVWHAIASTAVVEIRRNDLLHPQCFSFPSAQFLVRGKLPRPAV